MAREMLTPQIKIEGGGAVGLGFFLDGDDPGRFGHSGADEGFQALLTMSSESGKGIAIMGNSDAFFHVAPYVHDAVAKTYAWKPHSGNRNIADVLPLILNAKGLPAALDLYARAKDGKVAGYNTDESTLNQLGYQLLGQKKIEDAIQVFQRNVQEYPTGWNCYDSLGEAYMNAGNTELAIANYQKSVDLNPKNQNGIDALKKLRAASSND
jgi:hypothetical protein